MKKAAQITRRGFLKAAGLAAGYVLFGFNMTKEALAATLDFAGLRQKATYETDAKYGIRKSQDNPWVRKLYDKDRVSSPTAPAATSRTNCCIPTTTTAARP